MVSSSPFAPKQTTPRWVSVVLYQHRAEIHEPAMDEMECQDPHLPAAVNGLQGAIATGQQHQLPTSKSKYFDTSRCMMSHMI